MIKRLSSVLAWLSGATCPHIWRPAMTSVGPAKHCPHCKSTEQITLAEFYAQFNRMPYPYTTQQYEGK